mmetsp:Transcript_45491/g.66412  ORF Transcript_45491/g.66412 Transcript_45491/m.66412 type:complete len:221 (+) Transcript_45491:148-810(+)
MPVNQDNHTMAMEKPKQQDLTTALKKRVRFSANLATICIIPSLSASEKKEVWYGLQDYRAFVLDETLPPLKRKRKRPGLAQQACLPSLLSPLPSNLRRTTTAAQTDPSTAKPGTPPPPATPIITAPTIDAYPAVEKKQLRRTSSMPSISSGFSLPCSGHVHSGRNSATPPAFGLQNYQSQNDFDARDDPFLKLAGALPFLSHQKSSSLHQQLGSFGLPFL